MLYNLCAAKNYASLIMLGFLVVLFIVMLVVSNRQKKKQQKEIQEKLDSLNSVANFKRVEFFLNFFLLFLLLSVAYNEHNDK